MTARPEDELVIPHAKNSLGIQSDVLVLSKHRSALSAATLCSIADLSVQEMAAIMELAHAVKNHPEDFRHALDARQMVLFFEKASLRTRLFLRGRHQHARRQRHLRRPDAIAAR